MNDILKLSVCRLSELLGKKEISSSEITAAYLERISKTDGKVGAFLSINKDNAEKAAADSDKRRADGKPLSALDGIPCAVKDNICTKGVTTTCASVMLRNFVPPYNATVVDKLENSGIFSLGKLNLDELKSGARISVDDNKRNPKDFVLWFTNGKFKDQVMVWPSPWGVGYPGWHLECSAMSMKYLGRHFDIHCGGIDAIPVHHTNEIAQSEAATGEKPWVNYWCHGEFLINDKGKMSKSSGEFLTLSVLVEHGYDPLDYRYFCLTGHYRSQLKFSYEALDHARSARQGLNEKVASLKKDVQPDPVLSEKAASYRDAFYDAMSNDLHAPQALAALWSMLKDQDVSDGNKLALLLDMDSILGLGLDAVEAEKAESVPEEVLSLVKERAEAKKNKDFAKSDEIRDRLAAMGWSVKDTPKGPVVAKIV